jgi:hypothetical protein
MADQQPPRPPTPTVVCRLCGQGIWTAQELVLAGLGAAHAACLERSAADDLTHNERSNLIRNCWNHSVARCEACAREYRLVEMGTDLLSGRSYFCPFCRAIWRGPSVNTSWTAPSSRRTILGGRPKCGTP